MKAIFVDEQSPSKALVAREVPDPVAGPGEVLIDVVAAGVNRADLLQRAGKYPPPPGASTILGLEVSGIVDSLGPGTEGFAIGDRVCALLSGGGYAERVAVSAAHTMRVPEKIPLETAAGIPEAFITALLNLCIEGEMKSGEQVLVHGGSSGVGTAAIQIARAWGARVACTVGNDEKARRCLELGAELAVNYRSEDFVAACREWSKAGVDLILDCVGGGYLARNLELLAPLGRIVLIASVGGAEGVLHIPTLMRKRARVIGSVLRSRSSEEKREIVERFSREVLPLLAIGEVQVVIDARYALAEAHKAHDRLEGSNHVGKVILQVRG